MRRIVSSRAEKTDQVVLLPSSLEDSSKSPPGTYTIFLLALCGSIFAFFAALVAAFIWRSQTHPYWTSIEIPQILWLSTSLILLSSVTYEAARRVYARGEWRLASRLLLLTAVIGAAFVASQLTAWRRLIDQGAYMMENPHGSFFYLFTGLHAAHLIGGMIALFYVVLGKNRRRELVNVVGYYWHFLTVLWLALFILLLTVS
jgi:cytochrome c oxidase subunit III